MKKTFYAILITLVFCSCSKERRSDRAGEKMQEFVINISDYARGIDSDFIVIPQNGAELAFSYLDQSKGVNSVYTNAIDGFGIEELFYNGAYSKDEERLEMLRELKDSKPVLVAEFVSNNDDIEDAVQQNLDEGFLCFPRSGTNYDYNLIPEEITNENDLDILSVDDAQNYLYLISSDNFGSKSEMIEAISATNYDLIIIDLFFEEVSFSSEEIESLKTKENGASRLVISYMNIGSAEKYRYYWEDHWKLHRPNFLKKEYDGYDDEIWVKFWKKKWNEIIFGGDSSYTKKVINAGFDGVYLDNVEAFYFLYFD